MKAVPEVGNSSSKANICIDDSADWQRLTHLMTMMVMMDMMITTIKFQGKMSACPLRSLFTLGSASGTTLNTPVMRLMMIMKEKIMTMTIIMMKMLMMITIVMTMVIMVIMMIMTITMGQRLENAFPAWLFSTPATFSTRTNFHSCAGVSSSVSSS